MIIGVTGSFGSGKTTVAKILAKKLKCGVLDADAIAKGVFLSKEEDIRAVFGTNNRKKLARVVFSDSRKLRKLNEMIHPGVIGILKSQSEMRKNVVWDVPLLVEAKMHKFADIIVVVKCAELARIKRLRKKGFTPKEIKQRTSQQLSIEKKLRRADYVVDNSGSINETGRQVDEILKKMKNK